MLSCKQAARLMSDAHDRPLSLKERLQLHLLYCLGCRRYQRQLRFLGQLCRQIGFSHFSRDD